MECLVETTSFHDIETSQFIYSPNKQINPQSQQQKHYKMSKISSKFKVQKRHKNDIIKGFWTYFLSFFSVSIADFKQVHFCMGYKLIDWLLNDASHYIFAFSQYTEICWPYKILYSCLSDTVQRNLNHVKVDQICIGLFGTIL